MKTIETLTKSIGPLLMLCIVSTAGATPPSGQAVDDGLICDEGLVTDASGKVTGFSPNGFNFQGIKQFTCADGTGEVLVNIQARIDFRKGITFHWNVLGGIGGYKDLHGAGSGIGISGVPCGDPDLCTLDVYDGGLHID
jgi:hypothetical protein